MDAKLLKAAIKFAKRLMREGYTYDQAVRIAGAAVRSAQHPVTLTDQMRARGFVR